MDVFDVMVHKCENVSILIDKKLRERRIEHYKFIIMLDGITPFSKDGQVKIIGKSDFEKLGEMIKSLKTEIKVKNKLNRKLKTKVHNNDK